MESPTADELLQFQDYPTIPTTESPVLINVNSNAFRSPEPTRSPLTDDGIFSSDKFDTTKGMPFLSFNYYKRYFNVDTYLVIERIVNSFVPKLAARDYLRTSIGENPDLYGPFWVTVTLIFFIAINGNIASYLQHANDNYRWHYNFHLVSYAATTLFFYVNILPIVLWALFKYSLKPRVDNLESENNDTYTPTLLSLICIYGYSLSIYIPVSILWIIQITFLQWCLVSFASLMSGGALITVLTPALRNSKYSLFMIVGILGFHFLLAACFMQVFFHMPLVASSASVASVLPNITATATEVQFKQTTPKQYVGDVA